MRGTVIFDGRNVLDRAAVPSAAGFAYLGVGRRRDQASTPPVRHVRVLVAGGAGFVGSHLVRRLLARGHDVICIDDLVDRHAANLADPGTLAAVPRASRPTCGEAPACDVDVICHLASPASPVDYDRLPLETLAANSLGTWRLLDARRERPARGS